MIKLKHLWNKLRSSFWFLPVWIVAFSIALAVGLIEADSAGRGDWMADWPRLFGVGAEGARGMLATIAGSMMTVVGVSFSMTLVTLALASSQYTSRILRNFMSDHATQAVLGIFTGIFTYCLIVLRTIRGGDGSEFVPSMAVTFSVVLAIGGIGTLIFFIHHIASSIQASSIIASVTKETLIAVDRLFPEKPGREPADDDADPSPLSLPMRNWQAVTTSRHGYLQSVDDAALMRLARKHRTIVRMDRGIGEFVVPNTPLASLALESPPDQEIISDLNASYGINRYRTVEQDCAFGIRQLVDMALRALSPGINDSTTAVMCVDYLTTILARLASREIPSSRRYQDGELRVVVMGPTFASLVAASFDEIRGSSDGNLAIMLRMLEALHTIGSMTKDMSRKRILSLHAQCIAENATQTLKLQRDRELFNERLTTVLESLQAQ